MKHSGNRMSKKEMCREEVFLDKYPEQGNWGISSLIKFSTYHTVPQCRQTWYSLKVMCQKVSLQFLYYNYLTNLIPLSAKS